MTMAMDDRCRCGHTRDEHDRPIGEPDDANAFCGECDCEHFREELDDPWAYVDPVFDLPEVGNGD
jgi:hypothetical protein